MEGMSTILVLYAFAAILPLGSAVAIFLGGKTLKDGELRGRARVFDSEPAAMAAIRDGGVVPVAVHDQDTGGVLFVSISVTDAVK